MTFAIKQPDLIYDVGMHKGEDTDFYLKKGFRVIGFEADPALVIHCKERFADDIASKRLIIVEGAIVDHDALEKSTIPFYRNIDNSVVGTVVENWMHRGDLSGGSDQIINVPAVNMAQCLEKYGVPYYLKIDIEGMDVVCLKALLKFNHRPDYISIESERASFEKFLEELDLFRKLGFSMFKAIQQADINGQNEPLQSREGRYSGHQFQVGSSGLFGSDLPGTWNSYEQIIAEYKLIFFFYQVFGDKGWLKNRPGNKKLKSFLEKIFSRRIPGWYDLHARSNNQRHTRLFFNILLHSLHI